MNYISLVSPLVDVGLVSPIVKFECKNNIKHFCEVTGVGPKIETSGRSKKMAKMAAFKILYDRIVSEGLVGDLQVSPSGSFELSKRKKNSKTSGAKKRRTEKFIKKYNIKTVQCKIEECAYKFNFVNNNLCRLCDAPLEKKDLSVVFADLERANGPADSDIIQLGLVKFSYASKSIIKQEEINVWPDERIDFWASKHIHKIYQKDGNMYQFGKRIDHVSKSEAVQRMDKFLQGSDFLICHGKTDFQTIRAMLRKSNQESPSYGAIRKVDSQKFYKSVMSQEYKMAKYGMQTIVSMLGDSATKTAYMANAHSTLCDAESLCSVSTGQRMMTRFKDWLVWEEDMDEEYLSFSKPEFKTTESISN